jgi:hypothetical protein
LITLSLLAVAVQQITLVAVAVRVALELLLAAHH